MVVMVVMVVIRNVMDMATQVYTVSRGNLKLANKKYSHVPNEYELTLNADAEVTYVENDAEIQTQKFDFVKIDQLQQTAPDDFVDVVGTATPR